MADCASKVRSATRASGPPTCIPYSYITKSGYCLLRLAKLLAQQRAKLGSTTGSARRVGRILVHRLAQVGFVFGTNRQLQRAALAIHADELGFDRVTQLQVLTGVVDTLFGDVGCTHIAFDAITEVNRRALGIDFLHGAIDDAALGVGGHVLTERVLLQLLDAQRNTLTFGINGQYDRLNRVALLEVAHDVVAGCIPRHVGQMHQAVDAAIQTDEHTEVGDGFDLAGNAVALLEVGSERFPRILRALLDAKRNATTLLIHVQHHDFNVVTDLYHFGRIDVLVGPIHFRHVHQAFDAWLDFDEAAVIGDIADLAEDAGVVRIATRDVVPRILAHLFEAKADAVALAIELEHAHLHFLTDFNHSNDNGQAFRVEGDGLRVKPPTIPQHKAGVNAYWYRDSKYSLSGDFEIAVRFDVAQLGPVGKESGYRTASVSLGIETGTPIGSVSLSRGLSDDKTHRYSITRHSPTKNGSTWDTMIFKTEAKRGRLVVRRVGAEMTFLVEEEGKPIRELLHTPWVTGPVPRIRLNADQGGTAVTPVNVLLSDLTVKAEGLIDANNGTPLTPVALPTEDNPAVAPGDAGGLVLDSAPVEKSNKWRNLMRGFGGLLALAAVAGVAAWGLLRLRRSRGG